MVMRGGAIKDGKKVEKLTAGQVISTQEECVPKVKGGERRNKRLSTDLLDCRRSPARDPM